MMSQEEVGLAHFFALLQLQLGAVEVEIGVQGDQEAGDWIAVGATLEVDDPDRVLQGKLQPLVQDEASSDVPEKMRTRQGDDGETLLVEEDVQRLLGRAFGPENREERPMQQPCA